MIPHERSLLENMGVRFHTPNLADVFEEAGLPDPVYRGGGWTSDEMALRKDIYDNFTDHKLADACVKQFVVDYMDVLRESERGDEYDVQSRLTQIRSDLANALILQATTNNRFLEKFRAARMGQPLQTIEELIGE